MLCQTGHYYRSPTVVPITNTSYNGISIWRILQNHRWHGRILACKYADNYVRKCARVLYVCVMLYNLTTQNSDDAYQSHRSQPRKGATRRKPNDSNGQFLTCTTCFWQLVHRLGAAGLDAILTTYALCCINLKMKFTYNLPAVRLRSSIIPKVWNFWFHGCGVIGFLI